MFFDQSVAGMLVGRSQGGKNYLAATAFTATGVLADGQRYSILRPVIYIDAEGSLTQGKMTGQPDSVVHRVGVSTPDDAYRALEEARSGQYPLAILDGWTRLFVKFAAHYQATKPSAKNGNQDWNRWARDDLARVLEMWFDLAVRPATRGIILLSTALLTDQWAGDFQDGRQVVGERIAVSETIGPRLMANNHFIWTCVRQDPSPILTEDKRGVDIAATNKAVADGTLRSRHLCYTRPFAGMQWVKYQDGFASDVPAITEDLDLGEVLTRHHERHGLKVHRSELAAHEGLAHAAAAA